MPNLIDIATLTQYMPGMGNITPSQTATLQFLISVVSADFLRAINRPDLMTGTYSEIREGDGGASITLRHWPITAVTSVTVGSTSLANVQAPNSTATTGFYVDVSADPERTRQVYLLGLTFTDTAKVVVQYSAGYATVPEDIQGAVADWVAARYQQRGLAGTTTTQASDRERADASQAAMPANTQRVIEKYLKPLPSLEKRSEHAAPPSEAKTNAARP